jgi:TPR repeat protein
MKTKRLIITALLLVTAGTIRAPAQQTETNQTINNAKFEAIKAKAEKGDAEAQDSLGNMYCSASTNSVDTNTIRSYLTEAVGWFKRAAQQGNADAQFNLGIAYDDGVGVPKDSAEAAKWVRKAAEQGNADAQDELGRMYVLGDGVLKDYAEAARWYRKAAEQGSANAQFELGEFYYEGVYNVAKDPVEATKWYRMAAANAAKGNEVAYSRLAAIYESEADSTEAIKLFREAAQRGYVTTEFLAIREKAEKGDPEAEWKLGQIFGENQASRDAGPGVPMDQDISAKWYRKAAEQGFAQAQCDLAIKLGISGNPNEGIIWLRKAAQNGVADAQDVLGGCYLGHNSLCWTNFPKDPVEAVKWLSKAAEQGNAEAQGNLGECYFRGQGATEDYVLAYKWVNLAAAHGYTPEYLRLSNLERFMTPEQIAQGQLLAREFKPRKALEPGKVVPDNAVLDSNPSGTGTGFFITGDGYLVTCGHVVRDAAQIRLVTRTGIRSAKVVQVDAANDLALLKADGRFAPLPVAASRSMSLGSTVATVGFPDPGLQGFSPKLAKGEIASLSGAGDDPRYFQISVPVQPGNSGGALVDERGNVIGIVSAKLDASVALAASGALPENVNYAVKSSLLLSFLESAPDVDARLKAPNTADEKFEEVVKSAQDAAVLVLVY